MRMKEAQAFLIHKFRATRAISNAKTKIEDIKWKAMMSPSSTTNEQEQAIRASAEVASSENADSNLNATNQEIQENYYYYSKPII